MARRRAPVGRVSESQRRKTQWGGLADQGLVAVASGGSTLIASTAFEAPGTIVRSRGNLTVQPQSFSADVTIVGAFGIGLVTAEALAIGITALPTPFRDSDWGGWIVWQAFTHRFESISQVGVLLGSWSHI